MKFRLMNAILDDIARKYRQYLPDLPVPAPIGILNQDRKSKGDRRQQTEKSALGTEVVAGEPGQQNGKERCSAKNDDQRSQCIRKAANKICHGNSDQCGEQDSSHLNRNEHHPVADGKFHFSHCGSGFVSLEVFRQVGSTYRAVFNSKPVCCLIKWASTPGAPDWGSMTRR